MNSTYAARKAVSRATGHYRRPDTSKSWCGQELDATPTDASEFTRVCKRCETLLAKHIEQPPVVHHFTSTDEAYDATQTREAIRDGDVLVVESEQVVAFLRGAWPAAITEAHGELHTIDGDPRTLDDGKYAASIERAEKIARTLGFPVRATEQPAPIVVRADEVRAGDTVLGCFAEGVTVADADPAHVMKHGAPYVAAPTTYNPSCGCGACEEFASHTGPVVNLAVNTPWETCDPLPAGDPVLIHRANVDEPAPVDEPPTAPGTLVDPWTWIRRTPERTAPAAEQDQADPRVIEGVIVAHNDRARGCAPQHAVDTHVRAALAALAPLALAEVTRDTDVSGLEDVDTSVRGALVEPRGDGRVAVYWTEAGSYVDNTRDRAPFRTELRIIADKLRAAGWTVEPGTIRCVMAWPPAEQAPAPASVEAAAPAPAAIAANAFEQAAAGLLDEAPADRYLLHVCEAPRGVCERGACRTSSVRASGTLAEVRDAATFFRHAWATTADGQPADLADAAADNRAEADEQWEAENAAYNLHLSETGHALAPGCCDAARAAAEAAEHAPVDDELATPQPMNDTDRAAADAEARAAAELVTEAEASDGTWRGGWIAGTPAPAADVLFDLDPTDTEQGALFA